MSKGWRVVMVIVMTAILLGAVCVGVGLLTGGEWDRVYSTLDDRYSVTWYLDSYTDYFVQVFNVLKEAVFTPGA